MNILFFGDCVGSIGIDAIKQSLPKLHKEFDIDFVIANGENASKGKGLTEIDCYRLIDCGVDVITLGNHYLSKSQIEDYIDDVDNLVRPANTLNFTKGSGSSLFSCNGIDIRVTNLLAQGMMNEEVSSPVETLKNLIQDNKKSIHIVDFHGESTSEKKMLAYYFDGQVSAVLGTHTHVQTNDDQILPKGTGFISDVGMCGALNSIIGFTKESVIKKFIDQVETRFEIDNDDEILVNGVLLNIDNETFECLDIEKIRMTLGGLENGKNDY